jgi:hypothetical protein
MSRSRVAIVVAVIAAAGAILAAAVPGLLSRLPSLWNASPYRSYGFLSPDKKHETVRSGTGNDVHCEVKEVATGRVVLVTQAEFDTPNDVKAGLFSPDSRQFAAAYHYGHAGGYTWVGVWDIETRARVRTERKPGWTTDLSWVFPR